MSDSPEKSTSVAQTAKKAGVVALITAVIPLAGYVAHLYQSYLEAQEVQSEIELEQRIYDIQVREARNADLKEYIPQLLSDEENDRALAVAMLTVLHPEEAPEIFNTVSKATAPEVDEGYGEAAEDFAQEDAFETYELEEDALAYAPAPAPVVARAPSSQKKVSTYLEGRAEAVKELPTNEWFVVLAVGSEGEVKAAKSRAEELQGSQTHEGGGTHYLTLGPYPSRDAAQRAMISARPRVPDLTPYLSRPLW